MLVLSRRDGERVRIGPDIRITVLSHANGQVRLGVEAPDDVWILREEVFERVEAANRDAARAVSQQAAGSTEAGRVPAGEGA